MSRFIHFTFFFILLLALVVFSSLYLYQESVYFHKSVSQKVQQYPTVLLPFMKTVSTYSTQFQTTGLRGILYVFAILFGYFLVLGIRYKLQNRKKTFQAKSSKKILLLTFLMILLTFGTIAGIYYWPEDEIHFGSFKIQRGTPEQFLAQVLDIGILVGDAHLFLFLLLGMLRCCFWKK